MADEKSHTEEGQIERAQRLRRVLENLKEDSPDDESSSEGKSLKEKIEEAARRVVEDQGTQDSD
jgi:hypothetical protein